MPGPGTFGAELRRHREEAGLSLGAFAELVNYSKSHLSKVETGAKVPSAALARRCDQVLAAGGALAGLVSGRRGSGGPPAAGAAVAVGGAWTVRLASDGSGTFSVDGPGGGPALLWTRSTPAPGGTAAPSTVDAFRAWLDDLRRFAQSAAPGVVATLVVAHTHALRTMAVCAGGDTRDQLFLIASRFAEFAGWMTQEEGNDDAASWWTRHAVELAARAGDRDLHPYASVRYSEIALHRGDPIGAVRFAAEAQRGTTVSRILGLAALREGQAYAMVGDHRSSGDAFDRAAEHLSRSAEHRDDGPVLGSATMPDPVAFARAWGLQELGRPAEAADILARELPRVDAAARRTRVRYAARLALATAEAGDLARACELVAALADEAGLVPSATIQQDLQQLRRVLGRWRRREMAADALHRLALALRAGRP